MERNLDEQLFRGGYLRVLLPLVIIVAAGEVQRYNPVQIAADEGKLPADTTYEHVLLFAGHMVDKPGRAHPRFPPAMEGAARAAIESKLDALISRVTGSRLAMSAAARGGDILFLEACRTRGVLTLICLPFPREKFLVESVEGVSEDWVRRFHAAWEHTAENARRVLPPPSAQDSQANVYERYNEWLVRLAAEQGRKIHLLTLWNGEEGDGPGGTADVVRRVRALRGEVIHIDSRPMVQEVLRKGGSHD